MPDQNAKQVAAICLLPWTLCAEQLPALIDLRLALQSKRLGPPVRQEESERRLALNQPGDAPALFFCYQLLTCSLFVDNR